MSTAPRPPLPPGPAAPVVVALGAGREFRLRQERVMATLAIWVPAVHGMCNVGEAVADAQTLRGVTHALQRVWWALKSGEAGR